MVIGFVGTGIMGGPMAAHLQAGGHNLLLRKNRSALPQELLNNGALEVRSLSQLAAQSDIVITMLPDTPDVEAALFQADGIAEGLRKGSVLIDMSSISPIETKVFATRIVKLGCDYLDAPVSGGEVGAKSAALTIMVGGDQAIFERALPLFALMGKNITWVGGVGAGQIAKVANQIIVALTIQAVAEGLLFASKAGADASKVREALLGGFASSRILEVHGERMIKRTFDPGFRIALHSKDLGLALAAARSLGLSLPNTAMTQEMFNACIANGNGGRDHAALVTALEKLANHEIA
jgi:2-hydroxy-3-oxopropionate reductase